MNNGEILNYPGLLRAFNKVDLFPNKKRENELLMNLSDLIDRIIQNNLKSVDSKSDLFETISVSQCEINELLEALSKKNIILYDGMTNEEALIIKRKKMNDGKSHAICLLYVLIA